jgi:hypothetical protein
MELKMEMGKGGSAKDGKGRTGSVAAKRAIDERVSGAVSDACAKLAVCRCNVARLILKAYLPRSNKHQYHVLRMSMRIMADLTGGSEVERHTSFVDCKASISADTM